MDLGFDGTFVTLVIQSLSHVSCAWEAISAVTPQRVKRGPLAMDGGPQGCTQTTPESGGTLAFSQEVKELSSGPYLLEFNP